jgi:hypothetical protein
MHKEAEAEAKLRSQLHVQDAHVAEAMAAISRCERDKTVARTSCDKVRFEVAVREKRRACMQLRRYRNLSDFSRRMLDSVTDANLVRESVETLSQVKQAFAGAGMDKLINQMQDTVGDLDDWKTELKGAQTLFQEPSRHGVDVAALDDEELLQELAEWDSPEIPSIQPPIQIATVPRVQRAAPHASLQPPEEVQSMASMYRDVLN